MSELLEFLRTHEEAFRSRARLASLYSDFRYQRQTNPDGYQANAAAWLRALTAAAKAGLIPAPSAAIQHDHLVLRSGEELSRALQTQEFGRPLALGAVIEDAVKKKDVVPLKDYLGAKQSVYAKSWIPTPWQVVSWGLRQMGVTGGQQVEDRLVSGEFVIMANVEAVAKAVQDHVEKTADSNSARVFSRELFATSVASAVGVEAVSSTDLSVLTTYLSRDRIVISSSAATGTIKFKTAAETIPSPVTQEDDTIASLRTLISSLESQIQALLRRVSELDRTAREAVANKQSTAAKSALRSKRLADTKLQQRTATLAQLEEVYAKIEQAADQVELVRVMEASSQTLRSLNKQTGGVEKVQDVMEGLKDEMMNADEIQQAMNDVSAGAVDEGEVEDELEALEKVEREKVEEAERRERESKEALERKEKERRDEEEAEKTRLRLAELDTVGGQGAAEPATSVSSDASWRKELEEGSAS